MGSWEKFSETSIPPKELFCSELNLEDITNEDYAHVQTVWDVFEIKIRNKVIHYCLQMYLKTLEVSVLKYMDLILLIFLSALRLAWQSCLEKTGVNLELLTDIDMLLKVGEGTRGGICQAIYIGMLKQTINIWVIMLKKITSYPLYLDANNLYGWAMSQKLPTNSYKDLSKFNEKIIKCYNENSDRVYFLEVDVQYQKNLFHSHKDLPFLPERKKFKKLKKLWYRRQRKICCSHKSFKTSIKPWINSKKSTQSNSI